MIKKSEELDKESKKLELLNNIAKLQLYGNPSTERNEGLKKLFLDLEKVTKTDM